MFLVVIEISIVILGSLFLWSQIIKPLALGLPILPVFRKTEKIKETIINKKGELHNENLLEEVDDLDTKIIEKRERRSHK